MQNTVARKPRRTNAPKPKNSAGQNSGMSEFSIPGLTEGVFDKPISGVRPSPENETLYGPINKKSPGIHGLSTSLVKHGMREPIVATVDGWIVSGHRRHFAAGLARLDRISVRYLNVRRADLTDDQFIQLLREYNRQREKTHAERYREALLDVNPNETYRVVQEERERRSRVDVDPITIVGTLRRSNISSAKQPMLAAIARVLEDRRKFWPLSDRQIHYALLSDPPLRHAKKPDSVYCNDNASYQSLVELLTRARLTGNVPMDAIADETRPVTVWAVHRETSGFVQQQLDGLLKGYYRDLLQSQPNHIELVGEKNTVGPILKPVAAEFCMPLTVGRGYCSLPPRAAMAKRFRDSGKEKLVLLIVSDFDPDGEEIAHSFARSLRDDFDVSTVHPIKVALTAEQVRAYGLPPQLKAKETSAHHGKFTAKHGDDVFELEALAPAELQKIVRAAATSVLDVDAYNREVAAERADIAHLEGVRRSVHAYLGETMGKDERA